jgi:hypothetical protein
MGKSKELFNKRREESLLDHVDDEFFYEKYKRGQSKILLNSNMIDHIFNSPPFKIKSND